MTDTHSPEIRSYNMSRIKATDTKPEIIVRKYLFGHGYRYRLHVKNLPGKPDIVLPKYKTVIFVNGCFWHGHKGCKDFVMPKSGQKYWEPKIQNNAERDKLHKRKLKRQGWHVVTVWECQLQQVQAIKTLQKLSSKIQNRAIS